MLNRICSVLVIPLCLILNLLLCDLSFAKDDELKPEEVVAQHAQSIGSPEALTPINTRSISGNSTFKFISGAMGQASGPAQLVSEKGKMGIVIKYGGTEYPGEHLAYDGKDVMVDNIKTGQRSPLGDFLYGHGAIMKNELLGGTLGVGWPLLNIKDSGARIKSRKRTIDGRELYELEYTPKKSMEDVKVKMYFDPATFRHVMTEYRLRLLLQSTTTNYVLTERFDDFRQVDNITLPYKYSINFMFEGGSGSLQTLYTFDIDKISHNGNIDPRFYQAQK
jgi:hypothetical protein